jgi:DNA ligase-1
MKPQLAEDAVLDKIQFPCGIQPKIDGVRALNLKGQLTGRSLDPFAGYGITEFFSKAAFRGLDGEMTSGNIPNCPNRLCSRTTGDVGRFKGVTEMADLHWWVFDLLNSDTVMLPYWERYGHLEARVRYLDHPRIHLVPMTIVNNHDDLQEAIERHLADGYEGTISRSLTATYKEGRATQRGQQLWRFKPWGNAEILVTGITEGQMNGNVAKTNTLGRTERSSAKAGMIPNGQVGSIQGTMLKDFFDPVTKKLLFPKGLPITVGSGEMSVEEATFYFERSDKIISHIVTFKHMTHGVKDLPRFPTYKSHRLALDLS